MATTLHGSFADPDLDGVHQLSDEGTSPGVVRVEPLCHEEQRTVLTQLTNLVEGALDEEKRLFERDMLVDKGGAGAKKDDEPDVVGDEQWIESVAEEGRELMTGEGTREMDLPQEWLGGQAAGVRLGGDGGEIKGQRRIDDGHGAATIGRRCTGPCGDRRHLWLPPQHG